MRLRALVALALAIGGIGPRAGAQPPQSQDSPPPMTWESVADRLDAAAQDGFAGAVLLVHDGKTVLEKGYGFADRDAKIPNTAQTVFGIGSTPIDFTKAGILLLAKRGKLQLSDPIAKYFKDVPDDKAGITLEHLMTGRSGLVDFHDLPTDENPDHSWIDREEAIRRIMRTKLLFKPGQGNEHSHSAYGLLAAVIEVVSGDAYQAFTRRELFAPAGMTDTGFFGDPIPNERMAIGYGKKSGSPDSPNAPPYWGKTSWLVMGSGGMTSTIVDLRRFYDALESGRIIDRSAVRRFIFSPGAVFNGGDMHGYEIVSAFGDNSLMIIVTNTFESPARGRKFRALTTDLATLVRPPPSPYMLGVLFGVGDDGAVTVREAVPGGPAEAAGLKAGDVIVSVNSVAIGNEPLAVLRPLLNDGKPIEFEVIRGGEKQKITVVPRKR